MINSKNAFLFIGGSNSHLPFIEAANNLNFFTVVFDLNNDCSGKKKSDKFYNISTHNFDEILKACEEISFNLKIKGVITYSSASAAHFVVCKIREVYNLPKNDLSLLETLNDKELQKKLFLKFNIPSPCSYLANNYEESVKISDHIGYPLIIKPHSDSQGSLGVRYVKDSFSLEKCFHESFLNSKNGKVLIEKFSNGQEFSVDGVVISEKIHILSICKKHTLGPNNGFIIEGFETALLNHQHTKEITELSIKTLQTFKVKNSFFSLDIIKDGNEFMVIECGNLLDCMIDRMLFYNEIDVYKLAIKMFSNIVVDKIFDPIQNYSAMRLIYSYDNGILKINSNHNLTSIIEWHKKDGDKICKPSSVADLVCISILENSTKTNYMNLIDLNTKKLFKVL